MIEFLRNLITFGTIRRVDNSSGLLRAQVETQGVAKENILYSNYGFASNPPISNKTLGINLSINGYEDEQYTLPFVADKQPKLETGESQVWTIYGTRIHLKKNGDIDINSDANININTRNRMMSTEVDELHKMIRKQY